jgi:predicted permease
MLFTLFNAYVLRKAAVKSPDGLYQLGYVTKRGAQNTRFSWKQYVAIRANSAALSDAFAANQFYSRFEGRNLQGLLVSGNYFSMLGVKMSLGRFILPEDATAPGTQPVVVLSNQTWRSDFARDAAILGRKVLINSHAFEVVGVCAPEFSGLGLDDAPESFYVPVTMAAQLLGGTDPFGRDNPPLFTIVGRVTGDFSVQSAQAALTMLVRRETADLPEIDRASQAILTSKATVLSLQPKVVAAFSPLMIAFLLVLMACCANVANMMLARAIARQREIGVRLALGASRARLVRQLLSEGLLLSAFSGAAALLVGVLTTGGAQNLLLSTMPPTYTSLVHLVPLHLDWNVFAFLILASAFATILSGLAPALQATRGALTDAIRGEFSANFRSSRLRSGLVVSQVTICLVLLIMTGVLMRCSASLKDTKVGFDTKGMVYPVFFDRTQAPPSQRLTQDLEQQPWVESMALALRPPLGGSVRTIPITPAGTHQGEAAGFNFISSGYFRLLGIPIVRGRDFTPAEMDAEAAVAIVSQATARHFWPNQDALGQTIQIGKLARPRGDQPNNTSAVIIGVAKDVVSGLVFDGPEPTMIYFPTSIRSNRSPAVMVRARLDSAAARVSLENALKVDLPDRAAIAVSVEDGLALQSYPFRAAAWIGFALGTVALLLTISGIYSVMSYLVSQRTKEIGIRMAVGASPGNVVGLILRQALWLAGSGLILGCLVSLGLGSLLAHVFYMIRPFDFIAYVAGCAAVMIAAMASAFVPSRRASRIDPVQTLRAE